MVRALVSSRLREKGVEEFRTLGLELAGTRFISLPHRFGARMLWGAAERQNAGAPRERERERGVTRIPETRLWSTGSSARCAGKWVFLRPCVYSPILPPPFPVGTLSSFPPLSFLSSLFSFIGLFLVSRYNSPACSLFCVEKLQGGSENDYSIPRVIRN